MHRHTCNPAGLSVFLFFKLLFLDLNLDLDVCLLCNFGWFASRRKRSMGLPATTFIAVFNLSGPSLFSSHFWLQALWDYLVFANQSWLILDSNSVSACTPQHCGTSGEISPHLALKLTNPRHSHKVKEEVERQVSNVLKASPVWASPLWLAGTLDGSKNVQHVKPEMQDAMLSPRISPVHLLHLPVGVVRVQPARLLGALGGEWTRRTRRERSWHRQRSQEKARTRRPQTPRRAGQVVDVAGLNPSHCPSPGSSF